MEVKSHHKTFQTKKNPDLWDQLWGINAKLTGERKRQRMKAGHGQSGGSGKQKVDQKPALANEKASFEQLVDDQ